MPTSLTSFGLHEMLRCSNGVRAAMRDAPTMEAAARNAASFFYDELKGDDDARACVLVRVYKTHRFKTLEGSAQAFARRMLPANTSPSPKLRCLTLLGTRGDEPTWNDRRQSQGHHAIPLPTTAFVERAPMIAAMIRAFGVDITAAVSPDSELMRDLAGKTYGVFHVVDARESPHIPAKDFVERHGIRSVVGFGGSLLEGDLFATLLFTRTTIDATAADRFRTLALDMKSRFFSYNAGEVFDRAS